MNGVRRSVDLDQLELRLVTALGLEVFHGIWDPGLTAKINIRMSKSRPTFRV